MFHFYILYLTFVCILLLPDWADSRCADLASRIYTRPGLLRVVKYKSIVWSRHPFWNFQSFLGLKSMLRLNLWNVSNIDFRQQFQQYGRFSIVKEKWSKILISFLSNGIATIIVFRNKHPLVLFGRKRWRVFQSPSKRFYRCNFFNLEPGISCDPHCGRAVGGQRIVGGALSDLFHPVCSHFSVSIPHFSEDDVDGAGVLKPVPETELATTQNIGLSWV